MGLNLTGRAAYGWLAAFALMFIGNLDGFLQIVRGKFYAFDFFHGARVLVQEAADGKILDYPINEFPFFSLMWGDLHAYVIAYPVNLAILNLILNLSLAAERRRRRWARGSPSGSGRGRSSFLRWGPSSGPTPGTSPIYLAVAVVALALLHGKASGPLTLKLLDFLPLAALLAALLLPLRPLQPPLPQGAGRPGAGRDRDRLAALADRPLPLRLRRLPRLPRRLSPRPAPRAERCGKGRPPVALPPLPRGHGRRGGSERTGGADRGDLHLPRPLLPPPRPRPPFARARAGGDLLPRPSPSPPSSLPSSASSSSSATTTRGRATSG